MQKRMIITGTCKHVLLVINMLTKNTPLLIYRQCSRHFEYDLLDKILSNTSVYTRRVDNLRKS